MSSKAISDGVLNYVSSSAMDTYIMCPRRYAGIYLLGHREEETSNSPTALGTWSHSRLEDWLNKGIIPGCDETGEQIVYKTLDEETGEEILDVKKAMAVASLRLVCNYIEEAYDLIPGQLAPGMEVEGSIEKQTNRMFTIAGVPVHGRLDFVDFSNPKHPRIADLKTSNGLKNCATVETLKLKTQVIVYVAFAFFVFPEAEKVTLEYLYSNTDASTRAKPKMKPVTVTFSREESSEALATLVPVVEGMKVIAKLKNIADAEPKFEDPDAPRGAANGFRTSCTAFGKKCHIKTLGLCKNPNDVFDLFEVDNEVTVAEDTQTDVTSRLRARKAEQTSNVVAEPKFVSLFEPAPEFTYDPETDTVKTVDSARDILREFVALMDRARALVGSDE